MAVRHGSEAWSSIPTMLNHTFENQSHATFSPSSLLETLRCLRTRMRRSTHRASVAAAYSPPLSLAFPFRPDALLFHRVQFAIQILAFLGLGTAFISNPAIHTVIFFCITIPMSSLLRSAKST